LAVPAAKLLESWTNPAYPLNPLFWFLGFEETNRIGNRNNNFLRWTLKWKETSNNKELNTHTHWPKNKARISSN
jgi:hypothetical protein